MKKSGRMLFDVSETLRGVRGGYLTRVSHLPQVTGSRLGCDRGSRGDLPARPLQTPTVSSARQPHNLQSADDFLHLLANLSAGATFRIASASITRRAGRCLLRVWWIGIRYIAWCTLFFVLQSEPLAEKRDLLATAYNTPGISAKVQENPTEQSSAKAYYHSGLKLVKEGSFDKAVVLLTQGVKRFPDSEDLLLLLAAAYQSKGEFASAQKALKRMIALRPTSGEGYLYLGTSLLESGDKEGAFTAFEKAHQLRPADYRVSYFLGVLSFKAGRVGEAVNLLQESARLKPDFVFAHHQLALIYLKTGSVEKAADECRKGMQADPHFSLIYYLLAKVYSKMGKFPEAQEQLRIYQRLRTNWPDEKYRAFIIP